MLPGLSARGTAHSSTSFISPGTRLRTAAITAPAFGHGHGTKKNGVGQLMVWRSLLQGSLFSSSAPTYPTRPRQSHRCTQSHHWSIASSLASRLVTCSMRYRNTRALSDC